MRMTLALGALAFVAAGCQPCEIQVGADSVFAVGGDTVWAIGGDSLGVGVGDTVMVLGGDTRSPASAGRITLQIRGENPRDVVIDPRTTPVLIVR